MIVRDRKATIRRAGTALPPTPFRRAPVRPMRAPALSCRGDRETSDLRPMRVAAALRLFHPAFAAGRSSLKDDTAIPPGCSVTRAMIEKNEPNGGVSGRLKL